MRPHSIDDYDGKERSRSRALLATIAIGVLVAVVIWVVAAPGHTGHARTGSARTSRDRSTAWSPAGRVPRGQTSAVQQASRQGPSDQAVPDVPPKGVTWQILDTVAVPSSPTAGPRSVTDGVPSGFAHTPTGALVAMVQISYRLIVEPNWMAVFMADVVPGPGRNEDLARIRAVDAAYGNNPPPAPAGTFLQLAGFAFVSYTPATAVIQLLSARHDGSYQISTETVSWDGSDWQIVLGPTGNFTPTIQIVPTTVGFVLWGGF